MDQMDCFKGKSIGNLFFFVLAMKFQTQDFTLKIIHQTTDCDSQITGNTGYTTTIGLAQGCERCNLGGEPGGFWLVVEPNPSEKYDFISWDDEFPN